MKGIKNLQTSSIPTQEVVGSAYEEILVVRDKGPNAINFIELVECPGIRWITSGFPDLETRETQLSRSGIRFVEPEEAQKIREAKRQSVTNN